MSKSPGMCLLTTYPFLNALLKASPCVNGCCVREKCFWWKSGQCSCELCQGYVCDQGKYPILLTGRGKLPG